MAVITPTYKTEGAGVKRVTWAALNSTDTSGKPVKLDKYPDKSVQFYGTFSTGTITLEGSNDPRADPAHADHASAEWDTLEDLNGAAISKTAEGSEGVGLNMLWVRPLLSGADGSDNLTASLLARG